MNAKIKKINAEYEKNAAKIAELQARQKELDKQRTELENLDIVGMVRSRAAFLPVRLPGGSHHHGQRPSDYI